VKVRLIAEVAGGLALAGGIGWLIRAKLKRLLFLVADWSIRTPEYWDLLETFCNEVAVLWLVFPLLDDLYDRNKDRPPLSRWLILMSFAVSFGFFVAALYSAKKKQKLGREAK